MGSSISKLHRKGIPTYALAYSGLADSYALLCDIGVVAPVTEMPLAKAAAQKAVDIDPLLAEGYTSRGFVKLAYDWDWLGAEADFRKALDLNPKYPTAHQWYASYLVQMGKFDRARAGDRASPATRSACLQSSVQTPGSILILNTDTTMRLLNTSERSRSIRVSGLRIITSDWRMPRKARTRRPLRQLRGLLESPGDGPLKEGAVENDPEVAASLGFAYASAGRRAEAEAILERLKALSERRYVSGLYLAIIYAGLKDQDRALEYLNKAYESRHPGLVLDQSGSDFR